MANKTFRKKVGTKNRNKKNLKKTYKRYKMKGGGIKYTDNKKIGIDPDNEHILYVKRDYLPELEKQNPFIYKYLKKIGTREFNGATYVKFESTILFYNVKDKGIGDSPKTIKKLKQFSSPSSELMRRMSRLNDPSPLRVNRRLFDSDPSSDSDLTRRFRALE